MITEQLAGDLMPYENAAQRRRQLTATGFLALGPTNYEEQDKGMLRMDIVDEQLDTMGRAFLGMTIGCARCHDHKFDPISTRDYYALAGILRSTKTLKNYTDNVAHWIDTPLPLDGEAEAAMQAHEKQGHEPQGSNRRAQGRSARRGQRRSTQRKDHRPPAICPASSSMTPRRKKSACGRAPPFSAPSSAAATSAITMRAKGEKTISFAPKLPKAGRYEVRVAFNAGPNRAERVPWPTSCMRTARS
jgi:hypothetical protein